MPTRAQRLIRSIGSDIYSEILPKSLDSDFHVFLVGKGLGPDGAEEPSSLRSRLQVELHKKTYLGGHISTYYPEPLFTGLLKSGDRYDLLDLENRLAESVHAVVMVIESWGSATELGAFAGNEKLAAKLIVVVKRQHADNDSFIWLGPIRHLKRENQDRILVVNDWTQGDWTQRDLDKLCSSIASNVQAIARRKPPIRTLSNLVRMREYVSAAVYVLEPASNETIRESLSQLAGQVDPHVAVETGLRILEAQQEVKPSGGYFFRLFALLCG